VFSETDDHMIADFDLENLPGANQIPRHSNVRFRRLRLATRMVVDEDHGGGCGHNSHSKYLAWGCENAIEESDGNEVMALDLPSSIEQKHDQTLTIRVKVRMACNMRFPILRNLIRTFTDL
jgi:hypothetical protein